MKRILATFLLAGGASALLANIQGCTQCIGCDWWDFSAPDASTDSVAERVLDAGAADAGLDSAAE